jgi:hypothetical protein
MHPEPLVGFIWAPAFAGETEERGWRGEPYRPFSLLNAAAALTSWM